MTRTSVWKSLNAKDVYILVLMDREDFGQSQERLLRLFDSTGFSEWDDPYGTGLFSYEDSLAKEIAEEVQLQDTMRLKHKQSLEES